VEWDTAELAVFAVEFELAVGEVDLVPGEGGGLAEPKPGEARMWKAMSSRGVLIASWIARSSGRCRWLVRCRAAREPDSAVGSCPTRPCLSP